MLAALLCQVPAIHFTVDQHHRHQHKTQKGNGQKQAQEQPCVAPAADPKGSAQQHGRERQQPLEKGLPHQPKQYFLRQQRADGPLHEVGVLLDQIIERVQHFAQRDGHTAKQAEADGG